MSNSSAAHWPLAKLRDITTKIGSGATPRGGKESYKNSGITLIRSLNVYDFKFDIDGLAFIDDDQARELSNVEVHRFDILLNITGASVARCCIVPRQLLPARVNQHVAIVRVNPILANPYYVLYVINSPHYKHHLLTLAQGGATREALTKDTIGDFEVPFPPLPTQRKIAAILSAYDDLIENNTRRIAILEEMAQALYREWFVHFRFPGHEKKRMVESALGMIPEGWEVVKVSAAVYIDPPTRLTKEGEKPFVPMGSLSNGSMLIDNIEYRAGNSGSKFKNGDTLFARITPCIENGKTGYVQFLPSDETVAFGSTEFIVLRSRTLCPEYVYLMARSNEFRDNAIKSMSGATGRQRVQTACFDKFLIAQPDSAILTKFSEQISPIFRSIHVLAKKNTNLRRTRDLLLPKLISGEVDVEGLDIETGEAMTEATASIEEDVKKSAEAALAGEQMMLWG
ncbi:MAG: restriction endonuclease subunit S [Ktedonobacteraceae bacterium]